MKTLTSGHAQEIAFPDQDESGGDKDHLACGCRPQMCLCGKYSPEANHVVRVEEDGNICKPCLEVWHASGCGACGCRKGNECHICQQAPTD